MISKSVLKFFPKAKYVFAEVPGLVDDIIQVAPSAHIQICGANAFMGVIERTESIIFSNVLPTQQAAAMYILHKMDKLNLPHF